MFSFQNWFDLSIAKLYLRYCTGAIQMLPVNSRAVSNINQSMRRSVKKVLSHLKKLNTNGVHIYVIREIIFKKKKEKANGDSPGKTKLPLCLIGLATIKQHGIQFPTINIVDDIKNFVINIAQTMSNNTKLQFLKSMSRASFKDTREKIHFIRSILTW